MKFSSTQYKFIFALLLTASILGAFSHNCYAQSASNDDEEQSFTSVEKISPQELTNIPNRTYDEGVTVKKIEVEGNNLVDTSAILKLISTHEGVKFDRNVIQDDLKNIYNSGYFTENLKVIPQMSSKGITLKIRVEENVPVTGFTIVGNDVVSTDEIAKIINSQTGLPQNINSLNQSIENIEKLYADKGFILARVKKIEDDPDGMINIEINEGIIDDIKITGNTRTKDFVIRRNITLKPGMVYNENTLSENLSRIGGTQAFSDVRRTLTPSTKNPDNYQLTVEVDEKRTGTVSLGGGVDSLSGVTASASFGDNNFCGRGQQLSTSFTIGGSSFLSNDDDVIKKPGYSLDVKFVEPRFKQSLTSLETNAFGRQFASYQVPLAIEKRLGGEIEVARPFKKVPHLAGSVSLGVEKVDVDEGDADEIKTVFDSKAIDISRRAEQLVGGTYISFGPSLFYDTRDNFLNPTKGVYASTSLKESLMLSGDAGSYGKVTASLKRFYPVGEKSTFLLGGKIGSSLSGDLPEFAAFRLGGSSSIRGLGEGNAGNGHGFMMASAEFRTPIPYMNKITDIKFFNNMRWLLFADAGTLFGKTLTNELYNRPGYGISVGSGLRVAIPGLGPVSLNYGFPLKGVGDGNSKSGHFSFGFGENY